MANRINLNTLVEGLQLHDAFADVPKYKVEDVVRSLFTTIENAVVAGDKVAIPGFGKFYKYERTKDGKGTGIFSAKFKPAKAFKDKVNA